jgi:hypothetical protein
VAEIPKPSANQSITRAEEPSNRPEIRGNLSKKIVIYASSNPIIPPINSVTNNKTMPMVAFLEIPFSSIFLHAGYIITAINKPKSKGVKKTVP